MRHGLRATAASLGLALLFTAGCGGRGGGEDDREVRIDVDKPVAYADEPVRIRVTGLAAGREATVVSKATDFSGVSWTGRATFAADEKGVVDPTRAAPKGGTYRTADGMGLFWSMNPDRGPADEATFVARWPEEQPSYDIRLEVHVDGERVASRALTRTWMREGVTHRALSVAGDGVKGSLYVPPADVPRRPPVLSFGGSNGGVGDKHAAALLASRGHPVLTLCYFGCPERPDELERIELEYFAKAARLLNRTYGTGSRRASVIGYSRGSEAAQLLAHHYPDLVHDVVVYAPSQNTHRAFPDSKQPAWTKGGKPVEHRPIPLDRVRGTVLAIAGDADGLWPSAVGARDIGERRGASGGRHRALVYPGAGHGVGMFPYTSIGLRYRSPLIEGTVSMGGTRQADARAKADGWPRVLDLLGG
ncbi:acyl-CoA thioesterase/bile acid-CoA:amino acid N-acyltransferase family protein [Streptomyces sp. NPDC058953]|uniref:acyl-CoA thioesterase/bile acid-CoA:amino acid N-acyltransferase family protein n=1 Tax=unclassified Streptomyces TaxID=2593676 RepID=UPI0036C8BCD2